MIDLYFLQISLSICISLLADRMQCISQQRYDSLIFAAGPGSWNLTCAVSLPVSFKNVAKLRRLISLPTTIQFAVIAKLRRLVSESTTIQHFWMEQCC